MLNNLSKILGSKLLKVSDVHEEQELARQHSRIYTIKGPQMSE